MEQSTGAAGGPVGKIALINHKHLISGRAKVLGGAGTIYSGPDNGDIKVGLRQFRNPVREGRYCRRQRILLKYRDGVQL